MAAPTQHVIQTHDAREKKLRVRLEKILWDDPVISPYNQLTLARIDLDQVRTYLDREEEQWVSFREDSLQRTAATLDALQKRIDSAGGAVR